MKKYRPLASAVAADVEYKDLFLGTGGAGAGIAATLLDPTQRAGDIFVVKKVDAGAGPVTITPTSGTIDGAASLALVNQFDAAVLITDGTNFHVVGGVGGAALGVSLQVAYDAGNTIATSTASGGAVALSKGAVTAAGEAVFTVTDASAIVSTAAMVQFVNSGSRTSGAMVFVNQTANAFTGNAIAVNLGGTSTAQRALVISEGGTGANTANLVTISNTNANRTSGHLLEIVSTGNAFSGDALNISLSGTSTTQQGIVLADSGTGANTNPLVSFTNTNAIRTTGDLVFISNTGDAFIGNAITVALSGASVAQAGLSISDNGAGANTALLVAVINGNDARTSGHLVSISNLGDAFTGACLDIELASAASAATGARGIVVTDNGTGANTAVMVGILNANAARTTGAMLTLTNAQDAFTGDALNIALSGTSTAQQAVVILDSGTGANTADLTSIRNTNAIRTSGHLLFLENTGDAFSGDALRIDLSGANTGQQGIVVRDTGTAANVAALVTFANVVGSARTTGDLLAISNDGDAFAGDALAIVLTGTSTSQQAITIADDGSGVNTLALVSIGGSNTARTGSMLAITNNSLTAEVTLSQVETIAANGQTARIRQRTTLHTLALAATSTIVGFVPVGAVLLAFDARVTTPVTTSGATNTFDLGTAADPDLYAANMAGALGTTASNATATADFVALNFAAGDVVFDAAAAETFTAGIVRVTITYIDNVAATS